MKIIVQLGIVLAIACQFVLAQTFEESELKCSHIRNARAMIANYHAPTVAQGEYDVTFYDIDIQVDPAEEKIYGTVGVKGFSLIESLDQIDLDLSYVLDVESVQNRNGNDLGYDHNGNQLLVTLGNSVNMGNVFEIYIKYSGKPQATGFGSFGFDTYNQEPMIWSLSEPYGARDWWPCKDTPNDKADSVNISLQVPTGLIAASNGKLVDTVINEDWTTYHWQERYPIATYLVSIAIHPYTVFYDWYKYTSTDSMRLEYYVFPNHFESVQQTYGLTKNMLGAMAQRFGEYPFIDEKYGHAEFVWGGGMEHQTLTSLGGSSEGLIAHELGHQWWGDMVTCSNFHHIWLNEGFATYSEALWYEIRDNDIQSLHNEMALNRNWYGWKGGTIYVEDTTGTRSIFNGSLSYAKASWVVHMLRHIVGDEDFFEGIQEYGNRYRFKSAVTEQFQEVIEEISGKDLDYFFQRWIYGELYPIYEVFYDQPQPSSDLLVQINQIQNSEVFEMPIDIKINFTDGSKLITVVKNTLKEDLFTIPISAGGSVQSIEFDPDNWILKKVSEVSRTEIGDPTIPKGFNLYHVYPNPFNSELSIRFYSESENNIEVNIYDLSGKLIWSTTNQFTTGNHVIKWDGFDEFGNKIPSGSYIVEAKSGDNIKTQKVMHIK